MATPAKLVKGPVACCSPWYRQKASRPARGRGDRPDARGRGPRTASGVLGLNDLGWMSRIYCERSSQGASDAPFVDLSMDAGLDGDLVASRQCQTSIHQFFNGTGRAANPSLRLPYVPLAARRMYQGVPPRREVRDQRDKILIWADSGGIAIRDAKAGKQTFAPAEPIFRLVLGHVLSHAVARLQARRSLDVVWCRRPALHRGKTQI
jgi:hypothetical protein